MLSHVVFKHLPDAEPSYGYVHDMRRVLRPGGWAAVQVWLGSAVGLDALRSAAADADLDVSHLYGAGAPFCLVRLQRHEGPGVGTL